MDNKNFVANEEATFVAPGSQNSPEVNNSQPEMAVVPSSNHPGPPPDYFTDDLPPAYQVASALPTYEEAELTKGKIKEEFILKVRFCQKVLMFLSYLKTDEHFAFLKLKI